MGRQKKERKESGEKIGRKTRGKSEWRKNSPGV